MKITTNTKFETTKEITPGEVLTFFLDHAAPSSWGYRSARSEALEGIVSRLLTELIASRALTAKAVEHIFDYYVNAED